MASYKATPNLSIEINGIKHVYRDLGPTKGPVVVLLNHWGATLDYYDTYIVDELAKHFRVIALNYRGTGYSGGLVPTTVAELTDDILDIVGAHRLDKFHLFGFSLGGFVAQEIAILRPDLIDRLVLAGTGPAGGEGIEKIGSVSFLPILKGYLTFNDPRVFLFFPSEARTAADQFILRTTGERKKTYDKAFSVRVFLRQLRAIQAWGQQKKNDLSTFSRPVLVANGDNDFMVPSQNSKALAEQFQNSQLALYPNSGHGGIFQYHKQFSETLVRFLLDASDAPSARL